MAYLIAKPGAWTPNNNSTYSAVPKPTISTRSPLTPCSVQVALSGPSLQ